MFIPHQNASRRIASVRAVQAARAEGRYKSVRAFLESVALVVCAGSAPREDTRAGCMLAGLQADVTGWGRARGVAARRRLPAG